MRNPLVNQGSTIEDFAWEYRTSGRARKDSSAVSQSQATPKLFLGFVAALGCLLFTLVDAVKPDFNPLLAFLAAATIFLEGKAPRHPVFGRSSTAFPLYVLLALCPGGSIAFSALVMISALSLRTLTSVRHITSWKYWEFVVDLVSGLVAVSCLKALSSVGPKLAEIGAVSVLLACVCHFLLRPILQNAWLSEISEKERPEWQTDQYKVGSLVGMVSFLGIPYGFLSQSEPLALLFLPLGPWLLARGLAPLIDPSLDVARLRFVRTLGQMEQEIEETSEAFQETKVELKTRVKDFEFLQNLAESLAKKSTEKEVLEEILWLAKQVANADSTVIFLERNGRLLPGKFKTPDAAGMQSGVASEIVEPTVKRAFSTRRAAVNTEEDRMKARLFARENQAVTVPMHNLGAIYLGRESQYAFSDEEVFRLTLLGQQAHLALKAARYSEAREQSLAMEARAREFAESLLKGMAGVILVMADLIGVNDPRQLLEKAGERLSEITPFDHWAIIAGEPGEADPQYQLKGSVQDQAALLGLGKRAMDGRQALLLNDFAGAQLAKPTVATRSSLICPMVDERGSIGAIILSRESKTGFEKRDLELMSILSYQLGSYFWGCHLYHKLASTHGELAEAHKELKLSQAKLVQSSKMAAVGQLAAGVAHELNTPLGAMMLAIEGAQKNLESKPERSVKRLERALKSGQQLSEIVNKLLFYSRDASTESQDTDINEVIQDTVDLIGNQIRVQGIELKVELGDVGQVVANQGELQQIAINLLTNAKDAVTSKSEGPKVILVKTAEFARSVELTVQDSGVGIDEDTKARIFEPFFTTKEVGSGTGLGLSVTKELVEKHGGAMKVESVLGKGTRFSIRLPKSEAV